VETRNQVSFHVINTGESKKRLDVTATGEVRGGRDRLIGSGGRQNGLGPTPMVTPFDGWKEIGEIGEHRDRMGSTTYQV
jgi:hypothetical protein